MSASSENIVVLPADEPGVEQAAPARFSKRRAYAQTFSAMVAIHCAGVLSGVLAARLLGPTGRGELAVIIFLPMLLVPVGQLELPRSLAYEVSRLTEVPRGLLSTSFWLAVALGLTQAIVLMVVLPLYLPPDKLQLLFPSRWFMLYLPATFVTATLMGSDQGRGRFGRFSFLLALPGSLYLIGILAAWGCGLISPSTFALGLLAATFLTAVVRLVMDGRAVLLTQPDWTVGRGLLKRGMSFYLPAIAGFVLSRADMFILVRLASTKAVGLYAIAQAIALGQIGAVVPFVHVSFAAVAGEVEPETALRAVAHHFRFAQLATLSAGLIAAALTPWVIRLLFGSGFLAATVATYLLIGGAALWGMSQVLEQGLRAASHPRLGIVSNLLGLGVMVALGIPACLRFGINGIAASLGVAQFVNLGLLITFCRVRLKMPLSQFWAFTPGTFRELKMFVRPILRRLRVVA